MMIFLTVKTRFSFDDPHLKLLSREDKICRLGFGVAVTYETRENEWRVWKPGQEVNLWEEFEGNTVVGFDVRGLYLPLLRASISPLSYTPEELDEVQPCGVVDLMDFLQKKDFDGQKISQWRRSGDNILTNKVIEHCKREIQLCIGLYNVLTTNDIIREERSACS